MLGSCFMNLLMHTESNTNILVDAAVVGVVAGSFALCLNETAGRQAPPRPPSQAGEDAAERQEPWSAAGRQRPTAADRARAAATGSIQLFLSRGRGHARAVALRWLRLWAPCTQGHQHLPDRGNSVRWRARLAAARHLALPCLP